MARDDAGEKTEAPTPRRRAESREKGQVAKSQDLTAAISLLGGMVILSYLGPSMVKNFTGFMQMVLGYQGSDAVSISSVFAISHVAIAVLAKTAIPTCVGLMLLGAIVTLAQVGLLFTFHPIQPNLEKINPISGFGKIFSMQSLVKLFISIFKIFLIGAVAYYTIKERMGQLISMTGLDYIQVFGLTCEMMYDLGIRMGAILLILGIIDYAYQRYKAEQDMKMSKQELKEEMRRMEGDPLVRERQKRVARQLAQQRMQAAVPGADVVVTNPTHLAIAIKYDPEMMAAPKVIAKGADLIAKRIREIAIENGVPIVERKPLAQALYRTVEVGQEIPAAYYKTVAEILAYVYELSGKSPLSERTVASGA